MEINTLDKIALLLKMYYQKEGLEYKTPVLLSAFKEFVFQKDPELFEFFWIFQKNIRIYADYIEISLPSSWGRLINLLQDVEEIMDYPEEVVRECLTRFKGD